MLLLVVFWIFALIISYFIFKPFVKPYLKTREGKIKLAKFFGLLWLASSVFYGIVRLGEYFNDYNVPESFKKTEKLLETNPYVLNKIGSFYSYTYREQDYPKMADNPALIKIQMSGSSASVYLSCIAKKDGAGNWKLVSIKQDSILVNP